MGRRGSGPGAPLHLQPGPGWSPDSLFNLERTLFAVFFMSDMSSSSSSFVSGEVEGVEGRCPGVPPLLPDSQAQPLAQEAPSRGSGQTLGPRSPRWAGATPAAASPPPCCLPRSLPSSFTGSATPCR